MNILTCSVFVKGPGFITTVDTLGLATSVSLSSYSVVFTEYHRKPQVVLRKPDLSWNHTARKMNKYQKQKGNGEIQNQLMHKQHIRHSFFFFFI